MNKSSAIVIVLLVLSATSAAYAMSDQQAIELADAAYKGNASSLSKLTFSANLGDAGAQDGLGLYYAKKKNYDKARFWFDKSAKKGFDAAEFNFGLIYYRGLGVRLNYTKAVYWFEKAAKQGYAKAEDALGVAYYSGHGVLQDTKTAIYWWKKAVAHGGFYGNKAEHDINVAESNTAD